MIAPAGVADPVTAGAALLTGKKVAPDATRILMLDHREAFGLFDAYAGAADPAIRNRVLIRLLAALKAHMRVEEELVYPALRSATGDDALADHAISDHAHGRDLIGQIEAQAASADVETALVQDLRMVIDAHVTEEESVLFPRLREAGTDLFALGCGVAARRKEELIALRVPPLKDDTMTHAPTDIGQAGSGASDTGTEPVVPAVARADFVSGLRNAHAVALAGRSNSQRQIERLQHYPRLKLRLEQHAREKDVQIERLEQILDDLGENVSPVRDAVQTVTGNVGALFHTLFEDEVVKNSFATSAAAQFEISAYRALIVMGMAAGQIEAIRLLQTSLSELRGFAAWLDDHLPGTILMHLQLRSAGEEAQR